MSFILLLLFNGFILFSTTVISVCFFKQVTNFDLLICGAIAFSMVAGLAFIFESPLGQWFLRLISGARKTIERERKLLNPIIERVQNNIQVKHGLSPLKIHLMVIDDPSSQAFTIGKHNLVLSRSLYETATEEELAGVIAHELGHLHRGDSNKLGIALGVSSITLIISSAALLLTSIISKFFRTRGNAFFMLCLLVVMLLFYGFWLFVWLGDGSLKLAMLFVGRKQEYNADQFAVKAGFGAGLLSFLEKNKDIESTAERSFLSRLRATHPPVMLRIGQIEEGGDMPITS